MSELTDKMRTCAAYIMSRPHDAPMPTEHLLDDAAGLLNSAADLLEAAPAPLGEPMEILEPAILGVARIDPATMKPMSPAVWTDNQLPQSTPRRPSVCPKCDSHAGKTVVKVSRVVMLQCPVCDHTWKY
jgi:hypothetical protein